VSETTLLIKLAHLLGAAVLFGTGLGTAFFQWRADRSGDVAAIAVTTRHVVLADWIFTTPAIVAQPATGLWLALDAGYPLTERWLMLAIALYLLAGVCWLPVVWLQMRLRELSAAAHAAGAPLPPAYRRLMRIWFALGWPAFAAVVAIFFLMVFKPDF
jgi:uncharacterized membrane protein